MKEEGSREKTYPALEGVIFHDDVACLEDLERQRDRLVLPNGLQQARKQACADYLVFGRLWVRELHSSLAIILTVKPGKILVVRAENQRHDLGPAGVGALMSNDITELLDREWRTDGGGLVGRSTRQVVESICHADVFHLYWQ